MLILKLIRILLMPVFLTRNRLKGWFLPALARQEGIARKTIDNCFAPFKGGIGRGVEKSQINLLLTFMNNVDLRLKFFDSKLSLKTCTALIF